MKRWMTAGVALLAVATLPLLVLAQADAKAGKVVYDKRCASCHGPNGEGKPAIAKALKVELRHLGSKEVQAKSDAQLKKESVEGIGKMKAVAGMSDTDVTNLIAYMRTLKQ
jgi:mono/diheme cytochrome c family protein